MADEPVKKLIPAWLWAALATILVVLVIALFITDRREAPGPSFRFDVSPYAKIDSTDVIYQEVQRIPLQISNPAALTVSPEGHIYAAGENIILRLDDHGIELARFPVHGRPTCLAAAPGGKLIAGMQDHIEVFDTEGTRAAACSSLGQRAYLTAVAADDQNIFAADAGNRAVIRYDLNGELRGRIGQADPARAISGLVVPSGYLDLALDAMGALWIVNPGKHGLECYRPNGDLITSWYRPGMALAAFCGCCNPIHIAFCPDGALITAEKGINRVKAYAPDTSLLGVVATPEHLSAHQQNPSQHSAEPLITDLTVDARGRVLVLQGPARLILVYQKSAPTGKE